MAERMKVQQRQKKGEVKLHQVAEAGHYTRPPPSRNEEKKIPHELDSWSS